MEPRRKDARVRYTRMMVKNSFIRLLQQKSISKITVKEICDGAQINRATFYAHFTDPYDLLQQIEGELIDAIVQELSGYEMDGQWEFSTEPVVRLLDYIKENAEICNLLLNGNGDLEFQKKLTDIIGQQFLPAMTSNSTLSQEDAKYVLAFCAYGAVGMIKKWMSDGMQKSSALLAQLILNSALRGQTAFE